MVSGWREFSGQVGGFPAHAVPLHKLWWPVKHLGGTLRVWWPTSVGKMYC